MECQQVSRGGLRKALVPGLLGMVSLGWAWCLQAEQPANRPLEQTMREGAAAMAAADFARAADAYLQITHLHPEFAEGYFNLGLAEQQLGQADKARVAYEKARQLKPAMRGPDLFLGIEDYRENRFAEGEASLSRAVRMEPRNAKAWMWLGLSYLAEDKPQSALVALEKAYALDPQDADILYHRGRVFLLMANLSYMEMFKLNPDSVRVHQVLGEAYAQSYRHDSAIEQYDLAVRMAPHQPGLHEELGDQYWSAGKLKDAAEAYRHELANDPFAVTAKYKLGSLLVLDQSPAQGVELLGQVLQADPTLSDAHYYLGKGLMTIGQPQEAILHFQQAISSDPASYRAMDSWYKLAQIYRAQHDAPAAQQALQKFLSMKNASDAKGERQMAQIARRRSELPVEDPEIAGLQAKTEVQ